MELSLRDVGVQLKGDGRWLLRGVDIDVKPGQMLSVMGPCGSGKTVRSAACLAILVCSAESAAQAWRQGVLVFVSPEYICAWTSRVWLISISISITADYVAPRPLPTLTRCGL